MNGLIRVLTAGMLGISAVLSVLGTRSLRPAGPALSLVGIALGVLCAAVWLWSRPRAFELEGRSLVLRYPIRSKRIALDRLTSAEPISSAFLKERFRWALRVGVGGLFGGFGWLYTSKGWVEMAISRTDGLVLLSFDGRMPLLLTPAEPQAFVDAVSKDAQATVSKAAVSKAPLVAHFPP
jgi:hypothetical protein